MRLAVGVACLVALAAVACGENRERETVTSRKVVIKPPKRVTRSVKASRDDGFHLCRTGARAVVSSARHDPATLRRALRQSLPGDNYRAAFDGCLDAIWKPRYGPRPLP